MTIIVSYMSHPTFHYGRDAGSPCCLCYEARSNRVLDREKISTLRQAKEPKTNIRHNASAEVEPIQDAAGLTCRL